MTPDVQAIIDQITSDRSAGATQLAERGMDAFEVLADQLPSDPKECELFAVDLVRTLEGVRPIIGAIGVQAVLVIARARGLVNDGASWPVALRLAVRRERETLGQAGANIALAAQRAVGPVTSIATCSWSTTAQRAIVALKPELVCVGEGHKLGDGIKTAKWLAARGLEVEVLPDAALPAAMERCTVAIIGADQVLGTGAIVNRTGSLSLALAANYFGRPFYALCQRIKLSGQTKPQLEQQGTLFTPLPQGVTARAPLFEIVPPGLVHRVVTESGTFTPREAGEIGLGIHSLKELVLGSSISR